MLLFAPPAGLGPLALGAWLAFTAIGLRAAMLLISLLPAAGTRRRMKQVEAAQLAALGWACTIVLLALGALARAAFAPYRPPCAAPAQGGVTIS